MELIDTKYKQTEVGLIPEDWECKKVGEITIASAGGTPSTLQPNFWGGNIPWMNSGELNLKQVYDVVNRITEDGLTNSSTKFIPQFCVLIGLAGQGKTRGTAAINHVKLCTNQSIGAIYPSKYHDSFFLYYFIDSQYNELRKLSTGDGGRGGLNLFIIKNIFIPLPPTLEEQKAIATALSDVDELISNLDKLITKKKSLKQGAMQQLLTPPHKGGKRLEGFTGEWIEITLGDIGQCIIGLTYTPSNVKDSGTLVLRSSNIQNGRLSSHDNVYVDSLIPEKLKVKKNDILICVRNGSRNLIGKCLKLSNEMVGQTWGAFMSVYRSDFNDYVEHLFKSNIIQSQIEENLGATINQITNKTLNSFKAIIPKEIEEQQAITRIISDMDLEIEKLEAKKVKYQSIKQGMMQELLTGKTRLI